MKTVARWGDGFYGVDEILADDVKHHGSGSAAPIQLPSPERVSPAWERGRR
jgi:hypothetical protein